MQATSGNISTIIYIITGIFLLAGIFLIFYVRLFNNRKKKHAGEKKKLLQQYQQQLSRAQVEVQESTYTALGRELHDNVGQLLGSAKIMLGIAEQKIEKVPDAMVSAGQSLSLAIEEIRSLAKILSAEWLQQFSFNENLQRELLRLNNMERVKVHLVPASGELPLDAEKQIMLFRIVQEAIQNALKHAKATDITISIKAGSEKVELYITDNGSGFSTAPSRPVGSGLQNMKHRTLLLGGHISWNGAPGGGTIVEITVPVQADHNA